jgi:hypothetical protein
MPINANVRLTPQLNIATHLLVQHELTLCALPSLPAHTRSPLIRPWSAARPLRSVRSLAPRTFQLLYRTLFQRNSVYLTGILGAGFAFSISYDLATSAYFDWWNQGVSPPHALSLFALFRRFQTDRQSSPLH